MQKTEFLKRNYLACLGPLCARWRCTHPGVLNNLPTAVVLAFEDHYVAAFGGNFSPGSDCGESFLEIPAVKSQIAGGFKVLTVKSKVTVEGGHNVLEQGAQRRRPGNAVAVWLKEDGV